MEKDVLGVYLILGLALLLGLILALTIQLLLVSTRVTELESLVEEADDDSSPEGFREPPLQSKLKCQTLAKEAVAVNNTASSIFSGSSTTLDASDLAERGGLQVLTEYDFSEAQDGMRRVKSDSACIDAFFKPSLGVRQRKKVIQ
jgi:hypothetical protein